VDRETPQPTSDSKQQKFIGQLFASCLEVDQFAQLKSLTDSVAIARPELDGIHTAPPLDAKDTMLRLLSTFPQRSLGIFLMAILECIRYPLEEGIQIEERGYQLWR
jgi:hypothetical protein